MQALYWTLQSPQNEMNGIFRCCCILQQALPKEIEQEECPVSDLNYENKIRGMQQNIL